jgi:hypothetical protein
MLCLAPHSVDSIMGTMDCSPFPVLWPGRWLGYSDDPEDVCMDCPCEPGPCPFNDKGRLCSSDFVWSISASATDPLANVGPIPVDRWLYLWAAVADDFAAAEFRLTGTLIPLRFEPMNGVELAPAGSPFPDLLFTVPDCPRGPFLAGRILVEEPSSVGDRSWGRTKASYR